MAEAGMKVAVVEGDLASARELCALSGRALKDLERDDAYSFNKRKPIHARLWKDLEGLRARVG